jgi:hypothetical protein
MQLKKPIACHCTVCDTDFIRYCNRGSLTECTPCQRARRVRKWKLEHPDRVKFLNSLSDQRDPERVKARKRKWELKNPASLAAKSRRWRAANPEKAGEVWRRENERRRAKQRPLREAKRREQLANRSRQAILVARSVARKKGLPLPELPPLPPRIYTGTCMTCGSQITRKKADGSLTRCNACRDAVLSRRDHSSRRTKESFAFVSWADRGAISAIYEIATRASRCTGISFHVDHVIPVRGRLVSGLHVPENLRVIPKIENLRKNRRFEVA